MLIIFSQLALMIVVIYKERTNKNIEMDDPATTNYRGIGLMCIGHCGLFRHYLSLRLILVRLLSAVVRQEWT